jgi:hypothetical protein
LQISTFIKNRYLALGIAGFIALSILRTIFISGNDTGSTLILESFSVLILFLLVSESIKVTSGVKMLPTWLVTSMLVLVFSGIFLKLLFNSIESLFPVSSINYGKTVSLELLPLIFVFNATTIILSVASLVIFRHLFFLKQSKNLNIYFNAMLIFIALASFTSFMGTKEYESMEFLSITCYGVATILIFMNSLKISGIAFLK